MTPHPSAGRPGPDKPPTPSATRWALVRARVCGGPEFRLRVVSALILLLIALAGLWFGGIAFAALVAVGGALMLVEWRGITGATGRPIVVFALALAVGVAILVAEIWRIEAGLALIGLLALAAAAEPSRTAGAPGRTPPPDRLLACVGVVYAGLPWLAAVSIRAGAEGMLAMAFVFVVVWSTDIGAYFAGRALGGPKLMPTVSPKKTWSGALGGLTAAILIGTALVALFGGARSLDVAISAALMSIAAQAGDLYESGVKRRFGVKDSGTLIPGHGGILDRVDGLVAALVIAWLLGVLHGGGDVAAGILSR